MKSKTLVRRILKGVAGLATAGVLAIAVLLASLWLEHRTDVTLPAPTGSFAVGRTSYVWADHERPDTLAPVPGTKRELLGWIWYPSEAGQPAAVVDDYLPAPMRTALAGANRAPRIMRWLSRDPSQVHAHSLRNPDLSPAQPSYPVVIMRAGASTSVTNYTTLAEDLASHGYIVVGFDAPYRTGLVVFPDGRVIGRTPENNPELYSGEEFVRVGNKLLAAWTADIGFVLDQLKELNAADASGKFRGRIDMTRVGVFGHSLGGATAAQFCHEDSRCKAGIDVDGAPIGSVIQAGIDKPFMFLLSGHGDFSTDAEVRQILADIQSIYDRLPPNGRLRVTIRGANHFTFSDDGAVLKSRVMRGALRVFGKLGIEGRRQLEVTAYCVHSFFDAHLKAAGAPIKISPALYPELQVVQ